MKILIDATTTQDQFASRGIGRVTKEVIAGLLRKSKETPADDEYFLLLFNAPTTLDDILKEHSTRVRTVNIGKMHLSGKLNMIWWNLQYARAIRRVIKEEQPDVYFCPYVHRGFPIKGIKSVVMIYDFAFPVLCCYSTAPKYLDWIRKWQYHTELKRLTKAEKIIAISDSTRNDLLKYGPKLEKSKSATVYLGISNEFSKKRPRPKILRKYIPSIALDRGYILYYGGLEVNKNVPAIVRSYKVLCDTWDEKTVGREVPYLVLAGGDFTRLDMRYPVLAEVSDLINDLKLDDHVFFTGYYEDEHAVDLLNGASLFVHLSLYEGFGFSPLEAMKCGVPVVASDRSCYPEVLGEGALLVNPEDEGKVAEACKALLSDPKKSAELSKKGMRVAGRYSWESTASKMYKVLQEVAESKK